MFRIAKIIITHELRMSVVSKSWFKGKNEEASYKTRFIIAVFVNLGPSLVGKRHVLRIPPYRNWDK